MRTSANITKATVRTSSLAERLLARGGRENLALTEFVTMAQLYHGCRSQPNFSKKRTSRFVRSLKSFSVKKLPAARLLASPKVG